MRCGDEKGETRAARNKLRLRHFTARRPCFSLPLVRGGAVIPADDRRAESLSRMGKGVDYVVRVGAEFCIFAG